MSASSLGAGLFAYLIIIFIFLFISMMPLYFCIKWAVRKAISETVREQYLK